MGKPLPAFVVTKVVFAPHPDGNPRPTISIRRNLDLGIRVGRFNVEHATRLSRMGPMGYHGGARWIGGADSDPNHSEFVFRQLNAVPIYTRGPDGRAVHPGPIEAGAESWIRITWFGDDGKPHDLGVQIVRVSG